MINASFPIVAAALIAGLALFLNAASHYKPADDGKPQIIAGYPMCSVANSWRCGE